MTAMTAATHSIDHAVNPGLSLKKLENFLLDMREQPNWRFIADRECDYYDGNQTDAETLAEMEMKGLPNVSTNLIKPAVNAVLGMEAKNRTDWRVIGETEQHQDFAEALNVKLHQSERTCNADRAISDAFSAQIRAGVGWVEVSRETDPFKPKYRVNYVHRREIWWDWRAQSPLLDDARYLVRKKWYDEDVLLLMFPKHKELIEHAISGWAIFDQGFMGTFDQYDSMLMRQWNQERDSSIEETEWRDNERRRLCLYEVWYRVFERAPVLKFKNDMAIKYDQTNQNHIAAVQMGLATITESVFSNMRLSWWIGPHRLADIKSPYNHNYFPYAPFFGYREDRTNVPYGLIRSMISPQDEVNARKRKMLWLLSSKRVIADHDAVLDDDHESVAEEVNRPDAYIKLNANRRNGKDAFRIESDLALNEQQFKILLEAKQEIQDAGEVFMNMMGKREEGAKNQSGVAINSLIEQSTTTLTEIYDNYQYSRRRVGDLMLSFVKEDLGDEPIEVTVGENTPQQRTVVLNELKNDPQTGNTYRNNAVRFLKTIVSLEDVPSTPSYRAQVSRELTELTKSLPPELQVEIIDMVIEASNYPKRREMADRLRKKLGINKPLDQMNEQERQEFEAMAREQQRIARLQERAETAKIELDEAKAMEIKAKANQNDDEKYRLERLKIEADQERMDIEHERDQAKQQREEMKRMDELRLKAESEIEKARADQAKVEAETDLKRMELDIKRREIALKEVELDIKRREIELNAKLERERMKHDEKLQKDAAKKEAESEASEAGKGKEPDSDDNGGEAGKQPLQLTLNVDARTPTTKKTIDIKRNKDGLTGTMTEEPVEETMEENKDEKSENNNNNED